MRSIKPFNPLNPFRFSTWTPIADTLLSVCALVLLAGSIEAQVVNVCYGAQDGLFIPDYTNCSNYYACVNQIGYLQTCPSGYAFDSKAQACNYATVVTCSTCPSPASGLQFIAVPNVCDKYVICAGGSAFMQTCMDGLEYNNETTQCDFSRNVKCNPPPASCPSSTSDVLTFVPNGGECTRLVFFTFIVNQEETGSLQSKVSGPQTPTILSRKYLFFSDTQFATKELATFSNVLVDSSSVQPKMPAFLRHHTHAP